MIVEEYRQRLGKTGRYPKYTTEGSHLILGDGEKWYSLKHQIKVDLSKYAQDTISTTIKVYCDWKVQEFFVVDNNEKVPFEKGQLAAIVTIPPNEYEHENRDLYDYPSPSTRYDDDDEENEYNSLPDYYGTTVNTDPGYWGKLQDFDIGRCEMTLFVIDEYNP